MIDGPLVSILVPVRNGEMFIAEMLKSIARQDYRNFELVIVDDGSTDKTAEIVSRYTGPIKFHRAENKIGIAAALNLGLSLCSGEFVARMDADDLMYEWRLWDQVTYLLSHPGTGFIGSGADHFGYAEGTFRSPASSEEIVDAYLAGNPFIHPTIMFRRSVLGNDLYYDESLPTEEDYELWSRLILKYPCRNLEYPTIRYRLHAGGNQLHPTRREAKMRIVAAFLDRIGASGQIAPDVLVELQVAKFVSRESYGALKRYLEFAQRNGKPRLGWLNWGLVNTETYAAFSRWYAVVTA